MPTNRVDLVCVFLISAALIVGYVLSGLAGLLFGLPGLAEEGGG